MKEGNKSNRFGYCLLGLAISGGVPNRTHADLPLPISTSVRTVRSVSAPETPAGVLSAAPLPAAPPVTLPGERLPQYQISNYQSEVFQKTLDADRGIRFLLNTSGIVEALGRPLLIRARYQIDGQWYDQWRHQQAEALVTASGDVEVSDSEAVSGSESVQASAADGQPPIDESPIDEPPTESEYQLARDPDEIARRYAAAIGGEVSKNEADWLLSQWIEGPQVLRLHPYFQSFRGAQRPAFVVLDRDSDGVLSNAELETAVASLKRCDANRDDIVDVTEISRTAGALQPSIGETPVPPPLLTLLFEWEGITREHSPRYADCKDFDQNQDGTLDAVDIESLLTRGPDLDILIEFQSERTDEAKLSVLAVGEAVKSQVSLKNSDDAISVVLEDITLDVTAVQEGDSTQVSLGAVVDGYPLLPSLDPNNDGRLTLRELRQLGDRLDAFDRDHDGQLTRAETQPPIRLCFGRGAVVHRELAAIRVLHETDALTPVVGPDWFIRMDRNQDNDLTRQEFPGTDEQFEALDADGDSLVGADEAIEFEKQTNNAE